MKNIVSSISLFCKKYWLNFLMGVVYGLVSQFYWLSSPNMTSDQHKIFWIVTIFTCALVCKIADTYAQSGKYKILYRTYYMIFSIVEIILVLYYFISPYVVFQWI